MSEKQQSASAPPERCNALGELRLVHLRLMEHDGGDEGYGNEVFVAEVKSFVERLKATGAILDDAVDRKEAQGILDYWSSNLVSNGGVDLRTWSQPRIDAHDKSASSGASTADVARTKAELSKIDESSRQLIRISALARQWRSGNRSEGYLLGGDALENAKRFQGRDKDIDELIKASDEFVAAKSRNWRKGAMALIAVLLATIAGLGYLVWSLLDANSRLEKQITQNFQLGDELDQLGNRQVRMELEPSDLVASNVLSPRDQTGVSGKLDTLAADSDDISFPPAPPPPPQPQLPSPKSFDTGSEDVRLSAALDFNRRLRGKDNAPADQISLARSLVAMISKEPFAALSPEGRHYLLFILSLIPAQYWDTAEWSAIRDDVKTNLTDLQGAIDTKQVTLEPKSRQYLDALRGYVGLER